MRHRRPSPAGIPVEEVELGRTERAPAEAKDLGQLARYGEERRCDQTRMGGQPEELAAEHARRRAGR